jgi:hypothetical protein
LFSGVAPGEFHDFPNFRENLCPKIIENIRKMRLWGKAPRMTTPAAMAHGAIARYQMGGGIAGHEWEGYLPAMNGRVYCRPWMGGAIASH